MKLAVSISSAVVIITGQEAVENYVKVSDTGKNSENCSFNNNIQHMQIVYEKHSKHK
jgi:hypothetical protein